VQSAVDLINKLTILLDITLSSLVIKGKRLHILILPSLQVTSTNPSFNDELLEIQWMTFSLFDSVRKSLGTDEDVLFCHKLIVSQPSSSSRFLFVPSFFRSLTDNGERLVSSFFSLMFNLSQFHHPDSEESPKTNGNLLGSSD
jgi:hypothetical protein